MLSSLERRDHHSVSETEKVKKAKLYWPGTVLLSQANFWPHLRHWHMDYRHRSGKTRPWNFSTRVNVPRMGWVTRARSSASNWWAFSCCSLKWIVVNWLKFWNQLWSYRTIRLFLEVWKHFNVYIFPQK